MKFLEDGFSKIQLDIVGFLAILGEGSVLANAQVSSLSKVFFLPRLLPAPQALLRPTRPSKLDPSPGCVTGVYSGNDKDYVNHIGHIVLAADSMPDYAVRCVQIIRNKDAQVKMKTTGPLTAVAVFGCLESIALIALSILYDDGMALMAVLLLSFLSTLIGLGNKWQLQLVQRTVKQGWTPPGDVVIRYPKGSFLVVKCTEDVARELYFAPENIQYLVTHQLTYRLISLIGTLMLMFGIVALANAQTYPQVAIAAAYMLLNAAYWIVAALPTKMHWDTSAFIVKEQRFEKSPPSKHWTDQNTTFTQALWKAVLATKDIEWVKRGEAAPQTRAWDQWLIDAKAKANEVSYYYDRNDDMVVWQVPDWNPQDALNKLIAEHKHPDLVEKGGK